MSGKFKFKYDYSDYIDGDEKSIAMESTSMLLIDVLEDFRRFIIASGYSTSTDFAIIHNDEEVIPKSELDELIEKARKYDEL